MIAGTLLGFLRPETSAKGSERTVTFEERVAYQRAIEGVYWRHRVWPKERSDPKPSLDAVMSQVQLEKKVADYLRNSQALADYWQRPITAEQLQAEMDRMTRNTKQPEVLRELFEALGNDPFVVAECLARPALAARLVTNWYAYDQRIHNELKRRAEAELQAHPTGEQMKQTSGNYSEIELVKTGSAQDERNRAVKRGVELNSHEWDETMQKLAATFSKAGSHLMNGSDGPLGRPSGSARPAITPYQTLPIGKLSSLQEDETRYYATAVVEKNKNRLKLATVTWLKAPLESWRARVNSELHIAIAVASGNYTLPEISGVAGGCSDDSWTAMFYSPAGRLYHTAVWTGSEMIVWGGYAGGPASASGGRYDPATDTWVATSMTNAPPARTSHTAVWSGSEMIVWGGRDQSFTDLNTGGRYNPGTDSWTPTSLTNAPVARVGHSAVWTGNEMIIWGGYHSGNLNTGGTYNPSTDSWTSTSITNAPSARNLHTAVWTGSEMIVWGAGSNTGGKYNPIDDTWTATSTTNAPTARFGHTAVWTGTEMIVWGGSDGADFFSTGGKYNPGSDSWAATSTTDAPDGREVQTAVWTGSEMIVWGGNYFDGSDLVPLNTGGRYNPVTDSWTATDSTNAPAARDSHTAVWTGNEMIVWGGLGEQLLTLNSGGRYAPSNDGWTPTANTLSERSSHTAVWIGSEMIVWGGYAGSLLDTGGRYSPATNGWTTTSTANAPTGRQLHTAVWTGSEMIVWGGENGMPLNTGGRYNPGTDSWSATSTINAPTGREFHTAVWAGSEMIVWGGFDGSELNSGGRYNPIMNSWTATNTSDAPTGRALHTAAWTGSEMIVWGGSSSNSPYYLDTGGKYDPVTNSWTATIAANAPSGRDRHTVAWTGSEMIVWGGLDVSSLFDTGGRYNPDTDSWTTTDTANAPTPRFQHTAVWTGSEMIVWGGQGDNFSYFNTGGRYNPLTNSWAGTTTSDAPDARDSQTAVWAGSEMIIWGGYNYDIGYLNTGGRYCAQSGPTPTPTSTPRLTPRPRPTPHPRPTR